MERQGKGGDLRSKYDPTLTVARRGDPDPVVFDSHFNQRLLEQGFVLGPRYDQRIGEFCALPNPSESSGLGRALP